MNQLKLDYNIEDPQARKQLVQKILAQTPQKQLTPKYLEILTDYLIFAMNKQQKKQKHILTQNRLVTINKRETSYQGLVDSLENGQDGIYNMIAENSKNTILSPKVSITKDDVQKIPGMRELQQSIERIQQQQKNAMGKKKFYLKKQLIEMRQQQYILKTNWNQPTYSSNITKTFTDIKFDTNVEVSADGAIIDHSKLSLFNPQHISAILCNYSALKNASEGKFQSDSWYLIQDLDELIQRTLKQKYPLYYDLLQCKVAGLQNLEIQQILKKKHNTEHSIEYISHLWRNKIPKLLADQQQNDYLLWYYSTQQYGKWKRCSRCGEVKLAHNKFFSKNKSSKDGWYSICKQCRNTKKKEL